MSDRIESAERLLATVHAGQATVRALAQRYLPPGRALSLELHAISGEVTPTDLEDDAFAVLRSEHSLVAALASVGAPSTQPPLPPAPARAAAPTAPASAEPPPDPGEVEPLQPPPGALQNDQGDELLFELSGSFETPSSRAAEADSSDETAAPASSGEEPHTAATPGTEDLPAAEAASAGDAVEGPPTVPPTDVDEASTEQPPFESDADHLITSSLLPPLASAAAPAESTPSTAADAPPAPDSAPSTASDAAPPVDAAAEAPEAAVPFEEETGEAFSPSDPLLRADTLVGSDALLNAETLVQLPKPDLLLSADTLVRHDGPPPSSTAPNLAESATAPIAPEPPPAPAEVIDPGAVEPAPGSDGVVPPHDEDEEESASFERTALFDAADIFGDPTTGWGSQDDEVVVADAPTFPFDPNDAQVDELDDTDWGDDALDLGGPLPPVPDEVVPVTEAPPLVDDEDDVTRIDTPDPSVLAALRAAAAPVLDAELVPPAVSGPEPDGEVASEPSSSTLEDSFELRADELQWGNALGEPRTANLMRVAGIEPAPEPAPPPEDELEWSHDDPTRIRPFKPAASSSSGAPDDDLTLDEPVDASPDAPADDRPAAIDEGDAQVDTKMLSTRAFSKASLPQMAVPRVVEARPAGQSDGHMGAAAIQILGHGRAQTLTPTLELGEAPDDSDSGPTLPSALSSPESTRSDSFRLQFEEPDESSNEPHVPVLTESEQVQHRPVEVSPDGTMAQPDVAPVEAGLTDDAVRTYLAHATAAEQRGNLRDAVVYYDDLLSHDPHNVTAHLGRGRCLVDLGDYGSAMSDFTRAEDIAPDSPEPLVEMGNLFFARKEYKRAITYYNHAIDLDSSHAMAFSRRGISYYHRRQYAEAHNDLREAAKRDSSIPGLQRYIQMASRKLNSGH